MPFAIDTFKFWDFTANKKLRKQKQKGNVM